MVTGERAFEIINLISTFLEHYRVYLISCWAVRYSGQGLYLASIFTCNPWNPCWLFMGLKWAGNYYYNIKIIVACRLCIWTICPIEKTVPIIYLETGFWSLVLLDRLNLQFQFVASSVCMDDFCVFFNPFVTGCRRWTMRRSISDVYLLALNIRALTYTRKTFWGCTDFVGICIKFGHIFMHFYAFITGIHGLIGGLNPGKLP